MIDQPYGVLNLYDSFFFVFESSSGSTDMILAFRGVYTFDCGFVGFGSLWVRTIVVLELQF